MNHSIAQLKGFLIALFELKIGSTLKTLFKTNDPVAKNPLRCRLQTVKTSTFRPLKVIYLRNPNLQHLYKQDAVSVAGCSWLLPASVRYSDHRMYPVPDSLIISQKYRIKINLCTTKVPFDKIQFWQLVVYRLGKGI